MWNPYRRYLNAKRSASRTVKSLLKLSERLSMRRGVYVIKLTLTFPKRFSERMLRDPDATMKKAKKCFKDLKKYLEKRYLRKENEQLGLTQNLHLWSSSRPFNPHVHFHVSLVNLVWNGEDFIRFNPNIDLNELREAWFSILKKNKVDGVRFKRFRRRWRKSRFERRRRKNVNLHWQYIPVKNTYEAKHDLFTWFRYCRRHPVLDFSRFYEKHEFDESVLQNREFIEFLFLYRNQTGVCGWLRKINRILEELEDENADAEREEVDEKVEDEEEEEVWEPDYEGLDLLLYDARDWYCPLCGGPAKLLNIVEKPVGPKFKWDMRARRWVRVPPPAEEEGG